MTDSKVHPCCGCSCYVCAKGHEGFQPHTDECQERWWAEREATDGHSDREVAARTPARPDDAIGAFYD